MTECPNPDCRESLIKAMNSACKELRTDISRKVSMKALISSLSAIVAVGAVVATLTFSAYSRSQEDKSKKIENCEQITKVLDKNVAVMQQDISYIKRQLEKQGVKQEKILEILNELMMQRRTGISNP